MAQPVLSPAHRLHGPLLHGDGTVTFRVWAPRAGRVALVTGGAEHDMAQGRHGWFVLRVPAGHGSDYAFRLEDGPPLPDPASAWQPEGVHGPSRVVDLAALVEEVPGWRAPPVSRAVYYELHVGTFTREGTLAAAAAHLPRLADLGVTHVELQPLNSFNGERGWGYDGVGWWAVHEPYGGPAGLAAFVAAAHRAGLAVLIDAVYNHLGPSGNYWDAYGPYLTEAHRSPWGPAVNLDGPGSDAVRGLIVGSALHWLAGYGADGLRLDAVHGLVDTSAVHILAELSAAVAAEADRAGRPLALIAESDRNDPRTVAPLDRHGLGMDAQWADDLHHGLHVALTGEREGYYADFDGLADVAAAYRRGFVYDGRYSRARDHTVGTPLAPQVPGHRLVACLQDHDQIGNRALGERLTTLADPARLRAAILLLCAAPHQPLLFMGEEYGETAPFQFFTSHPEPELAEAVRRGRTEEFAAFEAFTGADVPDPQDPATAARSTLDHDLAGTGAGRARQALWRDLLALRRAVPALGNGRRDLVTVLRAEAEVLVLVRADPSGERVLVGANLGAAPATLALDTDWAPLLSTGDPAYGGDGDLPSVEDGVLTIPPHSATLLRQPAPDLP